jgi:hypothetical protein
MVNNNCKKSALAYFYVQLHISDLSHFLGLTYSVRYKWVRIEIVKNFSNLASVFGNASPGRSFKKGSYESARNFTLL